MLKKIYIITAVLFAAYTVNAQFQVDALRYSQQFYNGTGKSMAMGNALSAVGADMTALSFNPAGIAVFKKSRLELSPTMMIDKSESTYLLRTYNKADRIAGNTSKANQVSFGLSNFGIVGVIQLGGGIWKSINIGFTCNRTNDFKQDILVTGKNDYGSIIDYFVYNANSPYGDKYGDRWSDFREALAFDTWAIDSAGGTYFSDVEQAAFYGEDQRKTINTIGKTKEYDITLGANLKDILYIGAAIGIENVRYEKSVTYNERNYEDVFLTGDTDPLDPDDLIFTEFLSTKGRGFNFKLGVLVQPVKFLRIGGAIHSSTFFNLTDEYRTSMDVAFPTPDSNGDYDYFASTDYSLFDYKLKTPFRANAGIAFVLEPYSIGKYYTLPITLSLDYEYVDYSRADLDIRNSEDEKEIFDISNNEIDTKFKKTHSIKTGLEIGLGKFSVIGGYSVYSSPFKDISSVKDIFIGSKYIWSGGFGVAFERLYINAAYAYSVDNTRMYLYDATVNFPDDPIWPIERDDNYYAHEPEFDVKRTNMFFNITFGFKF